MSAYVRITDIDGDGRFTPDPKVGVSHPNSGDYVLQPGEIVFARTGASVGKSYLYDPRDGELVYAGFLINVAPNPDLLNPKYLALIAQTGDFWNWVTRISMRSGQPGINGREYAQLPIPLPDIETQGLIADAVTDIEELIVSLQRLLAKEEAIKLGVMQQLLVGSTRLPEFSDPWGRMTVGKIADVKTGPFGSALHERDYVSNGTPIITVEHLGERGVVVEQVPMVSASDRSRLHAYSLRAGDVVFSRVGAIDRNALISNLEEGWLFSGRLLRVRFDRGLADPAFMSAQFHSRAFREAVRSVAVGQTMPSLNTSILRGIPVDVPPLREQEAIAAVVIDLNKYLDRLAHRLAKAKAVKKGMLQELMNGRAFDRALTESTS
jgi:type I restriction enzyme S subunit